MKECIYTWSQDVDEILNECFSYVFTKKGMEDSEINNTKNARAV